MTTISSLGFTFIGGSDLARWEHFAVELLGRQVGRSVDGKRPTLRMDEHQQRTRL